MKIALSLSLSSFEMLSLFCSVVFCYNVRLFLLPLPSPSLSRVPASKIFFSFSPPLFNSSKEEFSYSAAL